MANSKEGFPKQRDASRKDPDREIWHYNDQPDLASLEYEAFV